MTIKELIKFFISQDADIRQYIKDELQDEINTTVRQMYEDGEIIMDYSKECSLRIAQGNEIKDINVDDFRQYWLKSYSGRLAYASDKPTILKLIKEYLFNHPQHTFKQCCEAAKSYVDATDPQYLMKCDNFIMNAEGKSTLEAVMDDGSSKNKSDFYDLI